MAIPSVMRGLIETENGKVCELDSPKGVAWLETVGSFRYEPTDGKPYTVRKEGKNGEYWYGCRKIEGTVRNKYIGKSSEVSVAKLEEIAEALEISAEPRSKQVAQVAKQVAQVAESRVTALELQVAELLKAVKDLQEALPGKFDAGNFEELPEVDNEVVERLQNELSNLQTQNENWRKSDFATIEELKKDKESIRKELRELRSQLATERADREEIEVELADQKQNSAPASQDLPEAADLLNQLKAKRKKSTATLADIEAILEMIEESCDDTSRG